MLFGPGEGRRGWLNVLFDDGSISTFSYLRVYICNPYLVSDCSLASLGGGEWLYAHVLIDIDNLSCTAHEAILHVL